MKKIYLIGGAILVVVAFTFIVFGYTKVDYVATMDTEVKALSDDLSDIDAQLMAGTMTSEEAVVAQKRISERFTTITEAIEAGSKAKLSSEQESLFLANLDRFKIILADFNLTLDAVDSKASQSRGNSNTTNKPLTDQAVDTVVAAEQIADEVIPEFEPTTAEDILGNITADDTDPADPTEEDLEDSTEDNEDMTDIATSTEIEAEVEAEISSETTVETDDSTSEDIY